MKKKLCALLLAVLMAVPLSGCVGELLLVATVATAVATHDDPYVLRINWGIRLPDGYEELFAEVEEGKDGNRYHVVRYEDTAELANWVPWMYNVENLEDYQALARLSLERMNIPQEFLPNFHDCALWFDQQEVDFRDKLLIIWSENTIYIIEYYM